MLDLLEYILRQGTVTQKLLFPQLDDACTGLPRLNLDEPCTGTNCQKCANVCPTGAIEVIPKGDTTRMNLDLGSCISCGLCIDKCPTKFITHDLRTATSVLDRQSLLLSNVAEQPESTARLNATRTNFPFRKSLAVRVVSTGCAACDLEVSAASNPIFDMERFGIQVVASPRAADALLVTGPVGNAMKEALKRTYESMAEPRLVIAAGTCACSGGIHKGGYAEANGVNSVLPVDVFIPGCPPHPWSIIHGLMLAMGRVALQT